MGLPSRVRVTSIQLRIRADDAAIQKQRGVIGCEQVVHELSAYFDWDLAPFGESRLKDACEDVGTALPHMTEFVICWY